MSRPGQRPWTTPSLMPVVTRKDRASRIVGRRQLSQRLESRCMDGWRQPVNAALVSAPIPIYIWPHHRTVTNPTLPMTRQALRPRAPVNRTDVLITAGVVVIVRIGTEIAADIYSHPAEPGYWRAAVVLRGGTLLLVLASLGALSWLDRKVPIEGLWPPVVAFSTFGVMCGLVTALTDPPHHWLRAPLIGAAVGAVFGLGCWWITRPQPGNFIRIRRRA
jgi:hypothetical protein